MCHFGHPLQYELELRDRGIASLHEVPPTDFPTLFLEVRRQYPLQLSIQTVYSPNNSSNMQGIACTTQ